MTQHDILAKHLRHNCKSTQKGPSAALASFICEDESRVSSDCMDHGFQLRCVHGRIRFETNHPDSWICSATSAILTSDSVLGDLYSSIGCIRKYTADISSPISADQIQAFANSNIADFGSVVDDIKKEACAKSDLYRLIATSIYASLKDCSIFIVLTNTKANNPSTGSLESILGGGTSLVISSKKYLYTTRVIDVSYKPAASLEKYIFYSRIPLEAVDSTTARA